ncbi:MAG: phosphatidate cytidylyltransferase [Ideonella sp.]
MLKQRIITALIMLAVLLPALFASSPWPFTALTLAMVAAAGWEWARLNGLAGSAALGYGAVLAAGCGLAWFAGWTASVPAIVWLIALAAWVLGGVYVLRAGVAGWPRMASAGRLLIGLLLLWTAWLALVSARALGINFILSLLCIVWMADIAAYFGGRAFGRRKLAPAISPGKSWAGVYSGMAATLVLALVWQLLDRSMPALSANPSWFSLVAERLGTLAMLLAVVFLAAMSVVGDLVESLVKRSAGAKDSSGLLPGHGGVLDRIDALLPVLPLALAFVAH